MAREIKGAQNNNDFNRIHVLHSSARAGVYASPQGNLPEFEVMSPGSSLARMRGTIGTASRKQRTPPSIVSCTGSVRALG